MAQAVEEWYKQMPIITRSYLTAAVVSLDVGSRLYLLMISTLILLSCGEAIPILAPRYNFTNSEITGGAFMLGLESLSLIFIQHTGNDSR